jgi:3-isopropylmalate/(R)-2-methylmalate dehydratase small subunit
MAEGLFANWKFMPDGVTPNPDFVLNQPRYQGAAVLLARENFGCGSSREHAPWALEEYGFKVIISSSYADIFYNNCFNNGMLPITLPAEDIDDLFAEVEAEPRMRLQISLTDQTVTAPGGRAFHFEIDPFKKDCLLKGLDNIGWTLSFDDNISNFEQKHNTEAPWLFAGTK